MIGVAAGEDLSFGLETAKGAGMDDAVAIALKVVPVRVRWFREAASAGMFNVHRVGGEHDGRIALLRTAGMGSTSDLFRLAQLMIAVKGLSGVSFEVRSRA